MKKPFQYRNIVVFMILICVLIASCNQKQKQKKIIVPPETESKSDEVYLNSLKIDSIKNIVSKKLLGIYYVENFHRYLEYGFELKKDKPKHNNGLYKFNFTENREIKFEDLTVGYDCGMGILVLDSGKWELNKSGNIELSISGEYTDLYKFNTDSQYKLSELKNGNIKMKLITVIKEK